MKTLLWYRFRVIWKSLKAIFALFGVAAGIVLLVTIVMRLTESSEGIRFISFFCGFLSIYIAMVLPSMLSIEEQEKNVALLLVLPLRRKQIAVVNYVITWIICGVAGLYTLLCNLILMDGFDLIPLSIGIPLLISTVYIPLFFYFGAQRAMIILLLLGATISLSAYELSKFVTLDSSTPVWITVGTIALLVLHGVSILLSIHKCEKKDF